MFWSRTHRLSFPSTSLSQAVKASQRQIHYAHRTGGWDGDWGFWAQAFLGTCRLGLADNPPLYKATQGLTAMTIKGDIVRAISAGPSLTWCSLWKVLFLYDTESSMLISQSQKWLANLALWRERPRSMSDWSYGVSLAILWIFAYRWSLAGIVTNWKLIF